MGLADLRTSCDIRVAPLNLNINTIPTNGCPSDFSGAVGQFNFDVNAAPMDVAVGDLVTLTMKIHGDGYLEPVSSPRLFAGQDFKIYDPEPGDGKPIEGEKTFTQICIPQNTNAVSIPAVSFSYFDGRAGTYKRITRGPFHLKFHSRKAASFEQYRPSQTTAVTTAAQNSGTGESMVSLSGTSPSYAGSLWRKIMHEGRQAVAIRSETAMFAPSHSSLVSFDVPNGRLVTVVEIQGNWSKIALGDKRGWVPTECLSTQ